MTSALEFNEKISQSGSQIYAADAQATDTYVITLTPTLTAYADGQVFNFMANTANTGAATLNIDGLGAIAILKHSDKVLEDNDIEAGQIVTIVYDGTSFQMQSQVASNISAAKMWVNFDGTGAVGPMAIRDSYNVTGVAKNSTGDYTITIDTDFANANYCVVTGGQLTTTSLSHFWIDDATNPLVGSLRVQSSDAAAFADAAYFCVACFGDQ